MTQLDKVAAASHNCKFLVWCVLVTVRKQFEENANLSYHVYTVIVVLHIYSIFYIFLRGGGIFDSNYSIKIVFISNVSGFNS